MRSSLRADFKPAEETCEEWVDGLHTTANVRTTVLPRLHGRLSAMNHWTWCQEPTAILATIDVGQREAASSLVLQLPQIEPALRTSCLATMVVSL
jgi:hypothetical protein